MCIVSVLMISVTSERYRLKKRWIYTILLLIGLLLEMETQAHDPAGDFDDPSVGYANTLIVILASLFFPGTALQYRAFLGIFFTAFFIRFALIYMQDPFSLKFWGMSTYYFPTIVFSSIFNHYWFRIKKKAHEQNHTIKILQKKLVIQERQEVVRDMHDYLGGGLTNLLILANSLKQGEVITRDLIQRFRNNLYATISLLRSNLQNPDEKKLLKDDFLGGLKVLCNRKYEISRRNVKFQTDQNLQNSLIHVSDSTASTFVAVLSEVIANDLKYGEGNVVWRFERYQDMFIMEFIGNTNYVQPKFRGQGKKNITDRLIKVGANYSEKIQKNKIRIRIEIPVTFYS